MRAVTPKSLTETIIAQLDGATCIETFEASKEVRNLLPIIQQCSRVTVALLLLCLGVALQAQEESQSNAKNLHERRPSEVRLITAADLADATAPRFGSYGVDMPKLSTPAKLDLSSNRIARTYRTVLREGMKEGPNYAGIYKVVVWGCGSSCAMFAVVNLNSGRVITADGIDGVSGAHLILPSPTPFGVRSLRSVCDLMGHLTSLFQRIK